MKKVIPVLAILSAGATAYVAYRSKRSKDKAKLINLSNQDEALHFGSDDIDFNTPCSPETVHLTKADLENYRIQSKVMLESYSTEDEIQIDHFVEFETNEDLIGFIRVIKGLGYRLNEVDERSVTISHTCKANEEELLVGITEVVEATYAKHGNYSGWQINNDSKDKNHSMNS